MKLHQFAVHVEGEWFGGQIIGRTWPSEQQAI
jgi:hypothetical protein